VAQTAREVGKFRPIKDKGKIGYDRRGEHVQRQISRRVRNAVHRLDELTRDRVRQASTDLLVVPDSDATGYVNASPLAAKHRDGGRYIDVYVGDPVGWRRYASARGIAEHELLAPSQD